MSPAQEQDADASEVVLHVEHLVIEFKASSGDLRAVDDISYEVRQGELLGIVGESGSGKSLTVLSLLGLIPPPGRVVGGSAQFAGKNLLEMSERELRRIRGKEVSMVFQDPMTSLNPTLTVGFQVAESIKAHDSHPEKTAVRDRVLELFKLVGIPNPEARYRQYPHEFSGGMRQRVVIAMAIANSPALLIADEPTSALDVTIQAQVLELLERVQQETNAATILITHDLGVVAELCKRVLVMYAGRVVESGPVDVIFHSSRHPYTVGLMGSLPKVGHDVEWLQPIPGSPPPLGGRPPGCPFHARCFLAKDRERCSAEKPELRSMPETDHLVACHFAEELYDAGRVGHG